MTMETTRSSEHQAPDTASEVPLPSVLECLNGNPVPAFIINTNHVVTHWNNACVAVTQISAADMVGTSNHWQAFYKHQRLLVVDLIVAGATENQVTDSFNGKYHCSSLIPGAYEGEDFFPHLGKSGLWLSFSASPLRDAEGHIVGAMKVLQDVTQRKLAELNFSYIQDDLENMVAQRTAQLAKANELLEQDIPQREKAEEELLRRNAELTELNAKLSKTQEQLMQADKLASIGQLAAGVAHEINNPIGYVFSNFGTLETYIQNLFTVLSAYQACEKYISSPECLEKIKALCEEVELDFLREDTPTLMAESKEGIIRVRKIVKDLKDFSHADEGQEWQWADLHRGIDSTLNIVNNEIKYKAELIKEYGDLPEVECFPSQINQVIMNIVVNAAHAITERGEIIVRTGCEGNNIWIAISDTGSGISADNLQRIFDPFYTTKPIGQGTGLGLSLSYGIIKKHQGNIDVQSEIGKGTMFKITLPIRQIHQPTNMNNAPV